MIGIREATRELAFIETNRKPTPETPPELIAAWDAVEAAAKIDPQGTWEIFKHGTNEEFAALVNCLSELGKEFKSDEAHREVMRLAKIRNNEDVMEQTSVGFGVLFDRFWNETELVG